jgi:acetate kinase
MRVLVLNRGSSSLKYALFEGDRRASAGTIERLAREAGGEALDAVVERIGGLDGVGAVGHRLVHGGASFQRSTRVDARVLAELRRLVALDPTHLPGELALVDAVAARAPNLAQVACFDTAFHAAMPRVSQLLAIPRAFEARGVRRYGFHGLSFTFLLGELARVAGDDAARGRVILAHLGSGASLAAVRDGRPIDTTMSFTPNSGIPMGTRSGDLDPGVVAFLARSENLSSDEVDAMLSERSGLFGLSDGRADVRDLLAREESDAAAGDALAVFCHAVKKAIGALAATLDGLDTLVFSAGIGERSPAIRARVSGGLGHLGVRLDADRNEKNAAVISAEGSASTVRVIPTDEEAVIARETLSIAGGRKP